MIALDSNILLRLLTRDDPRQVAAVERFMNGRPKETYWLADVVVAETVWALLRLYRWPRANVATALRFLAGKRDIEFEDRGRFHTALRGFCDGGDFADELIVERARQCDCSAFVSFDEALQSRHPEWVLRPK